MLSILIRLALSWLPIEPFITALDFSAPAWRFLCYRISFRPLRRRLDGCIAAG